MRVLILEVNSEELIKGIIKEGKKSEMPSIKDDWVFNFNKHIELRGKTAFILVKEATPKIIEGCMIFSLHETFGPYMDYLEVSPHNKGINGKHKLVADCLIAFACGLSFEKGLNEDKGILTFQAFSTNQEATKRLENFYFTKYGAIMNPLGYMEIYPNESRILIEKYLNNKELE